MAYINLPNLNFTDIEFDIKFINNESSDIYISNSLHHYLTNIKQQIDSYSNLWDYYKKITNPYEFIHTIVPEYKLSICKYKPLSRSFFKMIEIIHTFSFLNEKNNIKSFHLAEGPGGFIEAFSYKRNNKNDTYYGMTLMSDDINIPSWKKSTYFINNNKNVIIEYGSSKTGDLFLKQNLLYCYEKYRNSMDYITADGGFDFSVDFNKQEDQAMKLILAQIFFGLIMQKFNGNFVLKIFDIFKYKTVEIIFLLSNLYEYVYIYKPYTSRVANSEKYIICKNFKNNIPNLNKKIIENFDYVLNNIDNIYSLFNVKFPRLFINKIEEINGIYGQQQIENINSTLNIIREITNIKNNNTYNINYNEDDSSTDDSDSIEDNLTSLSISPNDKSYLKIDINDINDINELNIDNSYNINEITDILSFDNSNIFNYSPSISPKLTSPKIITTTPTPTPNDKYLQDTKFCHVNITEFNLDNSQNTIIKNINKIDNDNINKQSKSSYSKLDKFNNKINTIKETNINKSINWCNKYNFTLNKQFQNI